MSAHRESRAAFVDSATLRLLAYFFVDLNALSSMPHASVSTHQNDETHPAGRARRRRWLIVPAVVVLLAATLLTAIGSGVQREGYFSADDLYAATLIADLFSWSGSLLDWRLTPAPYFLPDLGLYALVRLASPNVEAAQYGAGLVHLLLFALCAYRLTRNVLGSRELGAVSIALGVLPLLVLRMTDVLDVPGIVPLFRITNHGGAALWAAVALAFCFGQAGAGRVSRIMNTVGCVFAGISDPLFAASCAIPLVIFGAMACTERVWGALIQRADPQRAALRNRFLLTGIAGLTGALLTSEVHAHLNELHSVVLSDTREDVWQSLLRDFSDPSRSGWVACVMVICIVAFAWTRQVSQSRALRVLALWQVTSFITTLAAMIWTRNYLDSGSLRYLTVPYALAPVTVAAIVAHALRASGPETQERIVAATEALMVVALAGAVVICIPLLLRAEFGSSWGAKAQCVRDVLQREQVDAVLTDYWRCKPLRLFSDGQVHALQMRAKLKRPYFWISSRGWYRGVFQLGVIATNELRPDVLRQAFGEPAQIDHCADIELFSYRDEARKQLTAKMNRQFRRFVADPAPP